MTAVDQAPTPIPLPADFPFTWPTPADAHELWQREVMHAPGQMTTLDFSVQERWFRGFSGAAEAYSLPIRGRYLCLNTYLYQAFAPVSHDPVELEAVGLECERRLGAALPRLAERWAEEQLPELKRILADYEAFDLEGAGDEELAAHVESVLSRGERMWRIHFDLVFAAMLAPSFFDDLYRDLFAPEDQFEAMRLVEGLETMTSAGNIALWLLAQRAAAVPAVREALAGRPALEALDALAGSEEGRAFLAELESYLDQWGRRTAMFMKLSSPSWIEEPTVVVSSLQAALAQPDRDPAQELARQAAERERLAAAARARLVDYPQAVRDEFETLLAAGQAGAVLGEDHNFWIDARGTYEARRVMLAAGDRLVGRGALDDREQVFHLTVEEIAAALRGDLEVPELAAARQAEHERCADLVAPPALGTLPPGPPPDSPVARALGKFFGKPPARSERADVLNGLAGSPGIARGRARVLASLAEADRLAEGDVLVTATTAPPWTPLFARAAAIVTDAGGILSHCAIVAREYRVPAVVGTGGGTVAIPDGALVEVDGTAGTVRILEG